MIISIQLFPEVIDNMEGSGNSNNMIEWSDDEDLGGEGSGDQSEGSGDTEHDHEQAIAPIITSEDVRHTVTDRITTATYKGHILLHLLHCTLLSSIVFPKFNSKISQF
ncbi:hypothetical protein LOAG_11845 [Loa loa]|uniref:Uncharacterized protein n=1 Tax=Loa loa TaxID=7209 RepID=A0A1S0TMA1_LOALO|nr:hypothetical protein LOAG_11845 [Loa loa]EFO16660.1 hypothetical protein LOAG_11845 [Loa loa]